MLLYWQDVAANAADLRAGVLHIRRQRQKLVDPLIFEREGRFRSLFLTFGGSVILQINTLRHLADIAVVFTVGLLSGVRRK